MQHPLFTKRFAALPFSLLLLTTACSSELSETVESTTTSESAEISEPAQVSEPPEVSEPEENTASGLDCDAVAASFATNGSVNANLADPVSEAVCNGDSIVVTSNGIPDYTYIGTSPGDPRAQDHTFTIPATPVIADEPSDVARLGPVAVALNGVPIYGPTEGTGGDVLSLGGGLSECGSHNGPTGFHLHLFSTSDATDCIFTPVEAASGPQLFGYAFDGYPIYTGNDQYTSSWELTDASLFASDTWSAHSYVEGSGDLDQCNGRIDQNGNYGYYTTDTFPYVLGCYHGEVDEAERPERPEGEQLESEGREE